MKPQDLVFIAAILFLIIYKKGKYMWFAGMISLLLAGLLFLVNNLFTSQRLSWYAFGFLLLATIRQASIIISHESKKNN